MESKPNKKLVFLCSGGGGNLRFISSAIARGWLGHTSLAAVLTDRQCPANDHARSIGVANECIDFGSPGQPALISRLHDLEPDLVVTTVHRILAKEVVVGFAGKLLNLHYSLLPSFSGSIGARPVQEAITYGAKFTGATVHLVDEILDGGRPVVQGAVPLLGGEPFDDVMDRVFRCGCMALLCAINLRLHGAASPGWEEEVVIAIKGRNCLISHHVPPYEEFHDEAFWVSIRTQP